MTIGHWSSLTEAQKLTQSQLIPGVIEEDIYRNNLLDRIPVAQARGKTIKFLREEVVLDSDVAGADIGEQLTWTSNMTYSEQEVTLVRKYIQRPLDHFIPDVYGTINDYEAQVLWEMKKGLIRRIGKDLIYDDATYGTPNANKQFDGLHAYAAVQTGTNLDIDEGEAGLQTSNLRTIEDEMKYSIDFWYFPFKIAQQLDEAYQEAGFAQLAYNSAGTMGRITYGTDDAGKRIMFWNGTPILRTDFLLPEDPNVGDGSNLRTTNTSETNYSVFAIKMGDVFDGNPGLCLGFGNTEMLGQFYKIVMFEDLEDYDAAGIRLVSYLAALLGSKLCLGRIFDIEDTAVAA